MHQFFKDRVIELEEPLERYSKFLKKESSSILKARYEFTLKTYLLNIKILSAFERYKPKYK